MVAARLRAQREGASSHYQGGGSVGGGLSVPSFSVAIHPAYSKPTTFLQSQSKFQFPRLYFSILGLFVQAHIEETRLSLSFYVLQPPRTAKALLLCIRPDQVPFQSWCRHAQLLPQRQRIPRSPAPACPKSKRTLAVASRGECPRPWCRRRSTATRNPGPPRPGSSRGASLSWWPRSISSSP